MARQRCDIFICYRRSDSPMFSEMLAAQLQTTFGPNRVFIDVENIRVAEVWPSRVKSALLEAKVVIVVIGKCWLSAADDSSRRRIDQPEDWIRREIETSLDERKSILPVLIDGAKLPERGAIPPTIAKLIEYQSHTIGMEGRGGISRDVAELVTAVGELLSATPPITSEIKYPFPILRIKPLDQTNLNRLTAQLPAWSVVNGPNADRGDIALMRTYKFERFLDVIHFMNTASRFIDFKDHHPHWTNIWQTLVVYLTTWDIEHKPTILDVDVATYLDKLYENYERKISQHDVREPSLSPEHQRSDGPSEM